MMERRDRFPRRCVIGAFAAVACAVLCAGSPALAAPPVVTADPTRHSDVAITDGSTYVYYHGVAKYWVDVACVAFVNNGPRMATGVGLNLAFVDATGTVIGVDSLYPTGKFLPGKRSAFSTMRGVELVENGNCHPRFAVQRVRSSTFQYRAEKNAPPVDVAAILVSVREIVYDDRTSWRTDQVPHAGDRIAIPSPPPFSAAVAAGPPVITARAVPNSPVQIDDTTALPPSPRGGQGLCVNFTNRDPRTAKRVDIALALVDRTGAVADVKTLYNKGTYSTGITIDNAPGSCTYLDGGYDGDGFVYGPGRGETPLGRIVATALRVEFADGTFWDAPNPPKAGDIITAP